MTLAVIGLPITLMTQVARGQESGAEGALAEALYREGRKLMAMGKVAEACPKFAESYRLDAATGTLLNLASCHENEHKLATAWFEFSGAVALARRDRRYDRVRFAQERLAIIEPRLSYLTVVVPPAVDLTGLEIRVDGVVVRSAARGVSTPVDPGDHRVDASAPGHKPWSQQVGITQDAMNIAVSIPVLEPDPTAPATPAPSESSAAPAARVDRGARGSASVYARVESPSPRGGRGHHRVRLHAASRPGGTRAAPAELAQNQRLGAVNLGLAVGALVRAGVTAYLYWTRPTQITPPRAATGGSDVKEERRRWACASLHGSVRGRWDLLAGFVVKAHLYALATLVSGCALFYPIGEKVDSDAGARAEGAAGTTLSDGGGRETSRDRAAPGCASDQACRVDGDDTPVICRLTDNTCQTLQTEECRVVYPRTWNDPHAVVLGAYTVLPPNNPEDFDLVWDYGLRFTSSTQEAFGSERTPHAGGGDEQHDRR